MYSPTLMVLLPYKITLLSNGIADECVEQTVLLPYKITLLSNTSASTEISETVLLPYKITLLSNLPTGFVTVIKFYYPIKLHYSQTSNFEKSITTHRVIL